MTGATSSTSPEPSQDESSMLKETAMGKMPDPCRFPLFFRLLLLDWLAGFEAAAQAA
jgi:hypothetical protein